MTRCVHFGLTIFSLTRFLVPVLFDIPRFETFLLDLKNILNEEWIKIFLLKREKEIVQLKTKNISGLTAKYGISSEENTEKQRCRFCLALNPNSSQHMIQHNDLSPEEWILFDKDNTAVSNIQIRDTSLNQLKSIDMNSDELSKSLLKMNISGQIKSEYNKNEFFYVWKVQDVLPSQTELFKESYIIKIDNEWKEFFNGEQKHTFSQITTLSDEYILRREDDVIFKLNSNQFYNCDEEEIKYEGEWVCDRNKQNPCVECSVEIEKMVFQCDHLANQIDDLNELNELNEKRLWKAKINFDSTYFKRRDIDTWEEYCNEKITDTFKFISFDKNDDLIIQRNSREFPDYLRFTNRDVFIGAVRDYIYTPLYTGFWQKEIINDNSSVLNPSDANFQFLDLTDLTDILDGSFQLL
ncbi:hypothetical protein BpHYR1_050633 [Brachionus plicatilis]|uniref:Uncharacterized protein n=1 Tax=Brachionus plicatilis TaxID=10195 RepID=A0A3M7PJD9_BRAPC|nr:hypothetical protein BpHYR1_050633 [Brachionus plicatilis]